MHNINHIKEAVLEAQKIAIVSHVNPDGDTLGSMLSLSGIIEKNFGKKTTNIIIGKIPEMYSFMHGIEDCKLNSEMDRTEIFDLVIAVDVAAKDRLFDMQDFYFRAKNNINIDHHITNNGFGKINLIDTHASSTGEIIYKWLKFLGLKLDKAIAQNLYVSILTDTGGFRYENTSADVFQVASELMEYGINPTEIFRKCYESKPKAMALLGAFAISNAVFVENDKIAYSVITTEDMKRLKAKGDYTEGISEALRQITTTQVAALLKEAENQTTKVSLRSKSVDVAKVAEVFGGGGHKFAAGCTIQKPPKVALQKLLDEIKKYI